MNPATRQDEEDNMRSKRLALTLAAVAVVAAVVTVPALAGGPPADLIVGEPEPQITRSFVDLDEEGLSAGDTVVEHGQLVDLETGADVGRAVTRVQVVQVLEPPTDDNPFGDFEFILDCTVQLDGGTLTFYGAGVLSELEDGVVFTLIGGTGRYAGTRGTTTVTAAEIAGEPGFTIAFDLTRR